MERLSDHERTQRHPVHRHQRERLQLGWHLRQRPAESNPGLTLSTAHGTRAEQVAEWFNTAAFCDNNGGTNVACPSGVVGIGPNGQDGSSGRNSLRSPRFYQPDLGLFRDLHISERLALQARAEASNVFNLVNLDNPGTVLGSKTFGVISTATGNGTSNMRELQLGLRLTF
jgi:hypothetical protein